MPITVRFYFNRSQEYEEHIEEVKRVVPKERLLVFNVKEGWEPLCNRLGLPVPDVPFPHVNSSEVRFLF